MLEVIWALCMYSGTLIVHINLFIALHQFYNALKWWTSGTSYEWLDISVHTRTGHQYQIRVCDDHFDCFCLVSWTKESSGIVRNLSVCNRKLWDFPKLPKFIGHAVPLFLFLSVEDLVLVGTVLKHLRRKWYTYISNLTWGLACMYKESQTRNIHIHISQTCMLFHVRDTVKYATAFNGFLGT